MEDADRQAVETEVFVKFNSGYSDAVENRMFMRGGVWRCSVMVSMPIP